jgi:glucosamine--fructose-6-phosphate aminotransferase (isomerizing)
VLAVAPQGAVCENIQVLLRRLKDELRAELLILSNDGKTLDLAHTPVKLPEEMPEWVSPMVSIIPAQLYCYHLTRAKGWDTEAPRGLKKVTETK